MIIPKGSSGLKIKWGLKIVRGGSYVSLIDSEFRSSAREKLDPDLELWDVGFRVVVEQ